MENQPGRKHRATTVVNKEVPVKLIKDQSRRLQATYEKLRKDHPVYMTFIHLQSVCNPSFPETDKRPFEEYIHQLVTFDKELSPVCVDIYSGQGEGRYHRHSKKTGEPLHNINNIAHILKKESNPQAIFSFVERASATGGWEGEEGNPFIPVDQKGHNSNLYTEDVLRLTALHWLIMHGFPLGEGVEELFAKWYPKYQQAFSTIFALTSAENLAASVSTTKDVIGVGGVKASLKQIFGVDYTRIVLRQWSKMSHSGPKIFLPERVIKAINSNLIERLKPRVRRHWWDRMTDLSEGVSPKSKEEKTYSIQLASDGRFICV
jgi:hypothetical protein